MLLLRLQKKMYRFFHHLMSAWAMIGRSTGMNPDTVREYQDEAFEAGQRAALIDIQLRAME